MSTFDPGNRLIAALDVADRQTAESLARAIRPEVAMVKIGLELFVAEGPDLVRALVVAGHRVMLDLKLHDIPATVTRATARVAELGVELLTVHVAGGRDMVAAAARAARRARESGTGDVRVLGVTVLTSLDQSALGAIGVVGRVDNVVAKRARVAVEAGAHGVVCSPREAARIRSMVPDDFLIVTPGVRPEGDSPHDQKRTATPADARQAGADMIVCGRPIRDAPDPARAARAISAQLGTIGGS